jgi:ankyrin repeat protein
MNEDTRDDDDDDLAKIDKTKALATLEVDAAPDAWPKQLLASAKSGQAELLSALITRGVDVNFQDERRMTALHYAAAYGARPCIRVLVATARCDYLLKDDQNRYAFELAIEWAADYAVARLLAKKQRQQALREGVPAWSKK